MHQIQKKINTVVGQSLNFQFFNKSMLQAANIYKANMTQDEEGDCSKNCYKNAVEGVANADERKKYSLNQGTISAGRNFCFCGFNSGFIAGGDTNAVNGKNNGVLCLGRLVLGTYANTLYRDFYDQNETPTNNGVAMINPNIYGDGITIVGTVFDYRRNDSSKPYNENTNPWLGQRSGFIQVSTNIKYPTLLKGYIKLDKDCHILDSSGKEIYNGEKLTSTIQQLEKEVAALKAQLT